VKQLASAALQALLLGQGPLAGLFGGGAGLLGGLLGGGGAAVGVYHKGGTVGAAGGASRTVSPAVFANAPRYHKGGIVKDLKPGERPIIAQDGEQILKKGQTVGAGLTSFNFAPTINAAGADPTGNDLQKMKRDFSKMVTGSVNRERSLNAGFA
jgi:hypothetical protein